MFFVAKICKRALCASTEGYLAVAASTPTTVTLAHQRADKYIISYFRDEKKLEAFLQLHRKNLTVAELKIFLPFTINLDPFIKKVPT